MSEVSSDRYNLESEPPISSEETSVPFPIEMYTMPGHGLIGDRSIKRYFDDKELQTPKIKEYIKEHLAVESIRFAPEDQRARLIEEAFRTNNPDIQKAGAMMIGFSAVNQHANLVEQAFQTNNLEIQKVAAKNIWFIQDRKAELEYMVLDIIEEAFRTNNPDIQKAGAEMIRFAQEDQCVKLIEEVLKTNNPDIQKIAAETILVAPATQRAKLIQEAFRTNNLDTQKAAAEMIMFASRDQKAELEYMVFDIVEEAFRTNNLDTQKAAAEMIRFADRKAELEYMVLDIIKQAFQTDNPDVQKIAAEMIIFAPYNQRVNLIKQAFQTNNLEIQKAVVEILRFIPEHEQRYDVVRQLIDEGHGYLLIESPLYKQSSISEEKLAREPFQKTGSETILLGKSLKDKVIVRKIKPEAFLAWQTIYENYELWKDAGFDYVPIEPIQSFRLNKKEGVVEVYSGVLDISLGGWRKISNMYHAELDAQYKKIIDVLDKAGFEHGHPHLLNFCMKFYRKLDGTPDFDHVPRLYLIDFDMAVSQ